MDTDVADREPEDAISVLRPTVLFVCWSRPTSLEFLGVARKMADDGRMRPVLAFVNHTIKDFLIEVGVDDLDVVDAFVMDLDTPVPQNSEPTDPPPSERPTPAASSAAKPPARVSAAGLARRGVSLIVGSGTRELVRHCIRVRNSTLRYMRNAGDLLDRVGPSVVVYADPRQPAQLSIAQVARKRGIVNIVVQAKLASFQGLEEGRQAYPLTGLDQPKWRWWKRLFALAFPAHLHRWAGGRTLYYPPPVMLALATVGCLPPTPWVLHGGVCQHATVWSEWMRRDMKARTKGDVRITVTGDPSTSELHAWYTRATETRERLFRELGFDAAKPFVLFNSITLFEDHAQDLEVALAEIDWLFSVLDRLDANVALTLHPGARPDLHRTAAAKWNIPIVEEPLVRVMAACDIYVAARSSTIRWAVLLGKQAVYFNHYGFSIEDAFRHYSGRYFVVTETRDEFPVVLERMIAEHPVPEARVVDGDDFAEPFDGRALERIVDVLWSLASEPAVGK